MNWICPHCNQLQTVTSAKMEVLKGPLGGQRGFGMFKSRGYQTTSIECSNLECQEVTIKVEIGTAMHQGASFLDQSTMLFNGQVYPSPKGRPQPAYIPKAIVSDYHEACIIRDLSPKASATLARRAVQGIIRDFAGISKSTLNEEVKELRKQVEDRTADPAITIEIVDTIDNIRSVGNIGAHMEKDVNLIIEVEPEEAGLMIELIEDMFEGLYVARHQRQVRAERMKRVTAEKAAARKATSALLAAPEASD